MPVQCVRLCGALITLASVACSSSDAPGPALHAEAPPVCPAGNGGSGGASGAEEGPSGAGSSAGGERGVPFEPCPTTGDCKILPLGDSITFGNPTAKGGYRVELFRRAAADCKHFTFVGSQKNGPDKVLGLPFPKNNEGHPGWTINQLIEIATNDQALVDEPHIVLLHIGTNDMFYGPPEGAPDRLAVLIDQVLAALPTSLLAVSTIIPLPPAAEDAEAFDAPIPGLVEERARAGAHIIYVDQFDGFPDNGLARDKVHPNDGVGYPWMGDTWYEAIKSYLR
jgi:hypothetical protein